jgi:hypothetical protein
MRRLSRRPTALALLAGSALLLAARPALRATGITFSYRMTSFSADKRTRESISSLATVRMLDGDVRMDYLEGGAAMAGKGGYLLFTGASGGIAIVNPQEKSAMVMSPETFGSGMGAMMDNPMLKVSISNQSFRYKDLGDGGTILGYRTRRVRTWTTSTVSMKMPMMSQTTTTSDSSDQWFATGFDAALLGNFEAWGKSFTRGMKATNAALGAEFATFQTDYAKMGIPLRTMTWSSVTTDKGKTTTDSLLIEVADLKVGPLDAALFRMPAGYTVTDMGKMMADVKSEMDKSKAESADEQATDAKDEKAKADEKPSAKDLVKQGIGGLLKRKKPPVP